MSDTPRTDAAARLVRTTENGVLVHANFARELERENAALREKFATIPDDVWSKADLVKQVHQALAERDDADRKNLALRNEIAWLNGQTMWVCACGGTDCEGQKKNAALKIECNRLRRALLDCSDAAIGGSTLAEWIRGKVATTLGKEAQPIRADHSGDINEMMQKTKEAQP